MKGRLQGAALALLLAFGSGGCSSLHDFRGGTEEGPLIYGGLRTFPAFYKSLCKGMGLIIFAPVDIALSLMLDTALLPITIPIEIFRDRPATSGSPGTRAGP